MTQTQSKPVTSSTKTSVKQSVKPLFGFQALLADLATWLRRHMLTVCFVLAVAFVNVATRIVCALIRQPFPPRLARVSFEALAHGHWYTAPISMLYVPDLGRLLIDIPLILIAFGLAESVIGKAKTVWVSVITTLGGMALGMGLCSLSDGHSPQWHAISHDGAILGPLILVAGTLMCASAFTALLWRRRIRVIGYAVVLIMFLYRGEASDYCLLAAALIGHVLGYLMSSATHGDEYRHGAVYEMRRLVGVAAGVQAIGSLVAVSSRQAFGLLSTFGLLTGSTDFDTGRVIDCLNGASRTDCFTQYRMMRLTMPGNWLVSIMPTLMLLLIAWGLYRGRRFAAILSIVFDVCAVALSAVFYVAIPLSYVDGSVAGAYMDAISALRRHGAFHAMFATVALPLLFIVVIVLFRRCFTIRTKAEIVMRGVAVTFATFVVLGLLYVGYGLSTPSGFNETPLLIDLIADFVQRLLPIGLLSGVEPAFVPVGPLSEFVYQCVGPVFWIVALYCAWNCLRDRSMVDDIYRHHVDRIIELGGESMSFMATWKGNDYWFSDTGRSGIAYRVSYGVALTVTGPFGDSAEYEDDLRAFTDFCARRSLTPVFYSVHASQRDVLVASGWNALDVGTEMVVDPAAWQTRGRKWQDVRTAINKAKRDGITDVLSTFKESPFSVQTQIREISAQWAGEKALPEMGFTLGGVDELVDPRVKLLYAVDDSGKVLGVTSWLPTYENGEVVGWTLDFMRHRTDSVNGIMEFLIARMAERLRDEGKVRFMSLSAAPLAGMGGGEGEQGESAVLDHVLQMVADIMEPAYGFHSLFRFKLKFHPDESKVYICYPDAAKLPQISLAVAQAYVPSLTPIEAMRFVRTIVPAKND
ncbi:bifunctional lysylphosphatidylglycerol flippase/synthetase MprF [Bifidobacterium sp.]|uniref:bifunctional lysylphosphatidylglycerol flippase/synthetase MprF n=1 Tax=Bifidobacterium sp. TaxID=41200 RepID=UPI003D7C57FD